MRVYKVGVKMLYSIKDVEKMSVDELIGQVIMVGLPGLELTEQYLNFIKENKIGNFILFSRNYKDTKQMKTLMENLYQYVQDITGSFPLVSIDQEGGMVVRLFKDVTFPASPLTTAASKVAKAPYKTGAIIGKDMLKLGINLDLAPCLEINENLSNPTVNVRSYGKSKEEVLKNAKEFVHGLQDSHALSCIKHFPGSGSTIKDSHLELPIINETMEKLLNYNMYPFINLLESDALMSTHCLFKSFDSFPTTLSRKLLTDVLRNEIDFKGLIISDGMEMKAIADTYGIGEGAVLALKAGCDILLLCHKYSEQKEAFDFVKKAVSEGEISVEDLKEKVRRINKAKEKVKVGLNLYFNSEEYAINQDEHELMQKIVDESYTLLMGTKPYIDKNTLVISSCVKIASIVEDEFDERNLTNKLKRSFSNNEIIEFSNDIDFIKEKINNYNHVLVYSYDAYKDNVQKEVINYLLNTEKEVHIVSIKGPIDRNYFVNLKNYSCLYEYTPNSIRTIIKQLNGEIELDGTLPK